jgi:hypothetical protein
MIIILDVGGTGLGPVVRVRMSGALETEGVWDFVRVSLVL